ncbi:MAG: DUF4365 domain-containing protein [Pseudonocardiaceae bacterium]|nr:MAG: DUF4365 domain-containing protein [Pseudonocardiaceae bacterium]
MSRDDNRPVRARGRPDLREDENAQTGDTGELEVAANFSRIGWGPVANTRRDLGTDIFVQARDRRRFDLVLFIAVQVKTGPSFFEGCEELDADGSVSGWWYYEENAEHFDDWVTHGLPHLLVLHDLETRKSYWVHVTAPSLTITGEGAKIFVPAEQTIDEQNLDALIEVASTQKHGIAYEGSLWRAAAAEIPPARRLRTAMITPRLVAPHRNAGFASAISPEEAIALLVQCRVRDLVEFSKRHRKVPSFEDAPKHRDWRWRFYGALSAAVLRGDYSGLEECIKQTNKYERKSAAIVALACWLMQAEKFDECVALLKKFPDRAGPIDHSWTLMQLARAQAEIGEVSAARENAAVALQGVADATRDDPTASAVRSAAASLLFYTADFRDENLAEVLSTSDHAAAWWRTQAQYHGLADHIGRSFRREMNDQSRRYGFEEVSHNQLYAATLTSAFSGDHGSWSNAIRLLAQNTLVLKLDSAASNEIADAIGDLRRVGSRSELVLAVKHAWAWKPSEVLRRALEDFAGVGWSHSSASSSLALLQHAGDLAVEDQADKFAEDLLSIIEDPTWFVDRVSPNFLVAKYVLDAARGLVASCTSAVQNKVANLLASLPPVSDTMLAVGYTGLADRIDASLLESETVDAIFDAAKMQPDADFSSQLLSLASQGGSAEAQAEVLHRVRSGDFSALSVLGDVRRLDQTDAKMLAGRDAEQLRRIRDEARLGSFGMWQHDSALSMAVIGVWFNDAVDWEVLADFIGDANVAGEHKRDCCIALAHHVDRLPEDAKAALSNVAPNISDAPFDRILGTALGGAGAYLSAALGNFDETTLADQILALLVSTPEHRADAAMMLGHLNVAGLMPLTVGLLNDVSHHVRLAAATSIAVHIVKSGDSASPIAMAAARRAIRASGAATALRFANAFYGENAITSSIGGELIGQLVDHDSSIVRARVRTHMI